VLAVALWTDIRHQHAVWVDVAILVVLGAVHVVAWATWSGRASTDAENKGGEGLRAAASGGLTVVGILVPVSLLAAQFASSSSNRPVPRVAIVYLFVAAVWLFVSLVLGLYVLFVAATRGYAESPLRRLDVGIAFGLQLIFLAVGVLRVLWGFWTIADSFLAAR
jgi:hypothetical protein